MNFMLNVFLQWIPVDISSQVVLDILWRKSLGEKCNIVDLDNTRLLGIEIAIKNNDDEIKLLFVNIYMPLDCADNTDEFMQYLSRVNDIFKHLVLHMCRLLVTSMPM